MEDPSRVRSLNIGTHSPSPSRAVPADCLEVEPQALAKKGYLDKVLATLFASKKASTSRIYSNTWKKFRSWCLSKGFSPVKFKSKHLLEFLQDSLNRGLSTSTLKRQVMALRNTQVRPEAMQLCLIHTRVGF